MRPPFQHSPVMVDRVVELLRAPSPGLVVDATVGGGGHASAILSDQPSSVLVGLDVDDEALRAASQRLAPFGDRVVLRRESYTRLEEALSALRSAGELPGTWERPAGVLLDLGVSSPQLDHAERGFSYRRDGPLDMRMDRRLTRSASELVNELREEELVAVLEKGGEDRWARRIAAAVVASRPLSSTVELAEVIASAVPARARRVGHPARRSFQALRIEVNGELSSLAEGLAQASSALAPGGRLVVLSYHSGEDRLVKAYFDRLSKGDCTCPPGMQCICGAPRPFRALRRSAELASAHEREANRRAEPARLRALERVADVSTIAVRRSPGAPPEGSPT